MFFEYNLQKTLDSLKAISGIEADTNRRAFDIANRVVKAEHLSDVEDISSEELLGLIPQLFDVFAKLDKCGEEPQKASQRLGNLRPSELLPPSRCTRLEEGASIRRSLVSRLRGLKSFPLQNTLLLFFLLIAYSYPPLLFQFFDIIPVR